MLGLLFENNARNSFSGTSLSREPKRMRNAQIGEYVTHERAFANVTPQTMICLRAVMGKLNGCKLQDGRRAHAFSLISYIPLPRATFLCWGLPMQPLVCTENHPPCMQRTNFLRITLFLTDDEAMFNAKLSPSYISISVPLKV